MLEQATAVLSDDGRYRYRLTRRWASTGRPCAFIGANPSTADATTDDATVRKMSALAQRWGCASLHVVNVAAYRATDPRVLNTVADPVGPDNDAHLLTTVRDVHAQAGPVVAAWGTVAPQRAAARATRLLTQAGIPLVALRITQDGHPGHPLYVPMTTTPSPGHGGSHESSWSPLARALRQA